MNPNRECRSESAALSLAYRWLARRAFSAMEMRRKLAERCPDSALVETVLGRLLEQGYLNDSAYAAALVEQQRRHKGWGRRRLEVELHRRGIEESLTEEALGPADDQAEFLRALQLAREWKRRFPLTPSRLFARLVRRGYAAELAGRVVRVALAPDHYG